MAASEDDALRVRLEELLHSGMQTEWRERAYTSEAVNEIIRRLQGIGADDYPSKLRLAGFTDHPFVADGDDIKQACETCMYYAVGRKFCDLPELKIPVKPEWSCRVWRI